MLTGLYGPTSGSVYINGYSISSQMSQIRRHLGIVPQHNVLWDTLTVKEHVQMIAVLKGTPKGDVERCVDYCIHEVGLDAKRDVYSAALSGGMKRKLSVAMALVGDSKIVFLSGDACTHTRTLSCRVCTVHLAIAHRCVLPGVLFFFVSFVYFFFFFCPLFPPFFLFVLQGMSPLAVWIPILVARPGRSRNERKSEE